MPMGINKMRAAMRRKDHITIRIFGLKQTISGKRIRPDL